MTDGNRNPEPGNTLFIMENRNVTFETNFGIREIRLINKHDYGAYKASV